MTEFRYKLMIIHMMLNIIGTLIKEEKINGEWDEDKREAVNEILNDTIFGDEIKVYEELLLVLYTDSIERLGIATLNAEEAFKNFTGEDYSDEMQEIVLNELLDMFGEDDSENESLKMKDIISQCDNFVKRASGGTRSIKNEQEFKNFLFSAADAWERVFKGELIPVQSVAAFRNPDELLKAHAAASAERDNYRLLSEKKEEEIKILEAQLKAIGIPEDDYKEIPEDICEEAEEEQT